jgi:hypothetical protein
MLRMCEQAWEALLVRLWRGPRPRRLFEDSRTEEDVAGRGCGHKQKQKFIFIFIIILFQNELIGRTQVNLMTGNFY